MNKQRGTLIGAAVVGALAGVLMTGGLPGTQATAQENDEQVEAIETQDISLAQAEAAIEAAKAEAEELGVAMNIAIVDAGTNLKAFARMDEAWRGSIDIAIKKARTSRLFDMPTGDIGELSQPGEPLYQIEVSNEGLITFPGGVPIEAEDGTVIGAIGVSGSTVEDDHQVATAGVEALTGGE